MKSAIVRPLYHTHLVTPPLGMGYVCAWLQQTGFEAHITDGLKERLDNAHLADRCSDADVVGIFCMSDYLPETADLTRRLKAAGKTVVIGGPHASVLPEKTIQQTGADYAVVGEGERTMADLVSALSRGATTAGIPGLRGREPQNFTPRPFFENLDDVPFPAWREIDPRTYPMAPHGGVVRAFPVAPVTSSRGCPFACHFCASPTIWHRRIRFRSPGSVVDEIEMLVRDYGVREIHFEDDNLTLKETHIAGICEEILRRGIKVHWAAPNGIRVDAVTPAMLGLMKRSGCYAVAFGIESGSQEILDRIEKRTDLTKMRAAITMAHDAGLITQAFLIFGLPGETEETIRQTTEFVLSLPLDKAQILLLDILPGSELWNRYGRPDTDYAHTRSYQEPVYVPEGLSAAQLMRARSTAFRRFHLRPRQFFMLLRMIKPGQLRFVLRRISDFGIFSVRRAPRERIAADRS